MTNHRSSWVRRLQVPGLDLHVKTYDYPSGRDRWRGICRNTGPWNESRAAREFDALTWLAAHAPAPAATPIAVFEHRRLGVLHRAVLLTETHPGEPLSTLLPRLSNADERTALARELGAFVRRLHELGFRDGNLDLRNVLAHRAHQTSGDAGVTWQFAKIDSPRYRVRPPGPTPDARTEADWQRLLPQLEPLGLAAAARAAPT